MKPMYEEVTEAIYNIGLTGNVWKMAIYDLDGDLTAFAIIDNEVTLLGYVHKLPKTTYKVASLKPGEKLIIESWKTYDFFPNIESKFGGEIPTQEVIRLEKINGFLCLVSYVPVMGYFFNPITQKTGQKQWGFVTAIQRLDNAFVSRISRLAGTRINIFIEDGLSTGDLREYKTFDLNIFGEAGSGWNMANQEILLNDISSNGNSYFQGVLPIYSDSKCLGAIVSLHSKAIAKANTLQMIRLLTIVSLACILLFLPITFVFSNSLTKPISKVVAGIREFAQREGSLDMHLEAKSKDEVDELTKGFSTFLTTIKKTQDQLRGLSSSIMTSHEKERTAIARELHDELGQMLTALNMDAVWMSEYLKKNDPTAADRALTMCGLINKTIDDVRGMALRLRPRILDDLGLVDALEWYTKDFEKRTGITCNFESINVFHINDILATAAYRIAQESLTNIARYSRATMVDVVLQIKKGVLTLTIADDGQGFDVKKLSDSDCLGIAGMRERASLVGGIVEIQSRPRKGTEINCLLPIHHSIIRIKSIDQGHFGGRS